MRNSKNVFHIAIPCKDLDEAQKFYVSQLGCRLARRYKDRITLDFFGDQLVCHLYPEKIDRNPQIYPRHFGITFHERHNFNEVYDAAKKHDLPFFRELDTRFPDKKEEHLTFFIKDPSNNLIEFKYYFDPEMMY